MSVQLASVPEAQAIAALRLQGERNRMAGFSMTNQEKRVSAIDTPNVIVTMAILG